MRRRCGADRPLGQGAGPRPEPATETILSPDIRAEFEKRNNEIGLEILDSFEEQWNAGEGLSDRQVAWLEKQLSWSRRGRGSNRGPDATVTADPVPKDEAELLDAMIERRLAAQGKTLIDAGQIDRLRKAVKDLNSALGALGD